MSSVWPYLGWTVAGGGAWGPWCCRRARYALSRGPAPEAVRGEEHGEDAVVDVSVLPRQDALLTTCSRCNKSRWFKYQS